MGQHQILTTVLPLRFMCTVAHLIATIMALYSRDGNITGALASSYTSAEYETADSSLLAAIWLTILCIVVEMIGIFGGFSMFLNFFNGYDIGAHFVATLMICWYIMEGWAYSTFWYFFAFFSLIPALFEVVALMRIFCCRIERY